ncbi:MAG: PfkB family carbohydrate kinase [Pseudomonadota bacterium]
MAGATERRIIFAGGAHVDWLGQFSHPAQRGLSVPGRWSRFGGGAAFNTACHVAALTDPGRSCVTLHSVCGGDEAGHWLGQLCAQRGVNGLLQQVHEGQTASYTAMVNPDGELVQALADMKIYARFDGHAVTSSTEDWLVVDANLPAPAISTILRQPALKRIGLTVSKAKAARLATVLDELDLLFTNASELAALLSASGKRCVSDLGVAQVVVSSGSESVEVWSDGVKAIVTPPPLAKEDIVSVIGAGDGLAGGTLVALMGGGKLEEAVQEGIRVAQDVLRCAGPWPDTASKGPTDSGTAP